MTSSAEAFRQLKSDAKVLESISQNYAPTSPEFSLVRRAAMALMYVVMHAQEGFAAFVEELDRDLSADERDELRDLHGINT